MMRISIHNIIVTFCGASLQLACSSSVNSYHVSQTGADSNPGTEDRPFKSLNRLNKLELKPGDKIYLRGGEIFTGTLSLTVNGTTDEPILITSFGDESATIDGGNSEAIIIRGNNFRVSNLHAKGSGRKTGNTTNGVRIVDSQAGVIENLKTEGFQKAGLELYNCKNIEVKKVVATDNGFCGIYVSGKDKNESKNILIKDCRAENNPGDPTNLDNHSGNGILVGRSDSVMIDHCTATNNGWDMPRIGNGPVGIWGYETDHLTIQYCISYRNKTSKGGKDGGGFDFDGGITNSLIQYCLSYENEGAGYGLFQYAGASLWYNNTVRYCISMNDATTTEGAGGIFMWNNSGDSVQLADCNIYNNLVYSSHAPAVQFEPQSPNKNFSFYNNIFLGAGSIVNGPVSGEKFLGNVWWNTGTEINFRGHRSLTEWSNATGHETLDGKIVGKQINPLLKGPMFTNLTDPYQLHSLSGYALQPGSPLKNSGLKLQTLFQISMPPNDFFGVPIPQGTNLEPGISEIRE